ncbi:hypothetical protein TUMSATVNIG1_60190 (plasmid) [Vibrio nigripulchritudo]|uniref:hypothetical protein n=1 Tax=Vibrio nigripulchritudo TaxID=28173 RepID=UPI00190B5B0D|nr:hypothetical protein [Vibrio nigripulchritudo]BCL74033.1 hypothetical protein VNTUMSATTG_59700 [Vibrio nigripulchritudo]BDU35410.1 hypothetical protein TUMSATVNIG1_60190 [Vibrio nigripulchritudo]
MNLRNLYALFLRVENDGTSSALENSNLNLKDLLSSSELLTLKFRFGKSNQAKFFKHFLSVRGSGDNAKRTLDVLETMLAIYASNPQGKLNEIVAYVLFVRVDAGLNLAEAMMDLFDSSFVTVAQTLKNKNIANLDAAITQATTNAHELNKQLKLVNLKLIGSVLSLIAMVAVVYHCSEFYQAQKIENPHVLTFVEEPVILFGLATFLYNNYIFSIFFLSLAYIANKSLLNLASGDLRVTLDRYWPPAMIERRKSAIKVFTGLSLLVGTLKKRAADSIDILLQQSSKYERSHLLHMGTKLEEGEKGTMQLDTGLLPEELRLTLLMAGEGEQASVTEALDIIATQGQETLTKTLQSAANTALVVSVFIAFAGMGVSLSKVVIIISERIL